MRSLGWRLFVALLAGVALFLVGTPTAGSATVIRTSERFEFAPGDLETFATCTGEVVLLRGFVQSHLTVVLNTPFHLTGDFESVLYGVGQTSGTHYLSIQIGQSSFNSNGLALFEDPARISERLVSQGSADDFVLTITAHITVNATGQTAVSFENAEIACQ